MKKLLALLLGVILLISTVGCSKDSPDENEALYSADGMSITLPDYFKAIETQQYAACYDSEDVAVFVVKEEFSANQSFSDLSLDEYAELVYAASSAYSPNEITENEGLTCMEYEFYIENDNQTYVYFTTIFKGSDAFWQVQFSCIEALYEQYKPQFVEWAKTVDLD